MKTQFLRRNKRYLTEATAVKVAGAVFVVLIIALFRFLFPNAFLATFTPLFRVGTAISESVGNFSTLWSDKAALVRERDSSVALLAERTSERDALAAKVEDLTRTLGTRSALPAGVRAAVVVRPPVSPYDSLVLDSGSESGIASGDLVLAGGGTPVGRVESVTSGFSRVTLFSANGVSTSVRIGAKRIPAVLEGAGAGGFIAELPKPNATTTGAQSGDTVYFSYDGSAPVGVVRTIATSPSSVTETLHISGNVNPFTLVWVKVVPFATHL